MLKQFIKERLYDYRAVVRFIQAEIENPNKPDLGKRIYCLSKGFTSNRYENYRFDTQNCKDFLPDIYKYRTGLISAPYYLVLNDKNLFGKVLFDSGVVPTIYGYSEKGILRVKGVTTSFEALIPFVEEKKKVMFKLNDDGGGKGIYRLQVHKGELVVNGKVWNKERFEALLASSRKYILTEFIENGDYAKAVYNGTTNTLRIITFIDPDTGEVEFLVSGHRFGNSHSGPTDNASQGGVVCYINPETGRLEKAQEFTQGKVRYIQKHPDTQVDLGGVQVPQWDYVKAQITDIARQVDFLKYVGWDVVVTNEGIRIIEGNSNPDFSIQTLCPYFKNPRFKRFLQYHHIIK